VTHDAALAERIEVLRVHGGKPKYYHALIGGNFRLDELQAAVLSVKLRRLDDWTAGRQRNAAFYDQAFRRAQLGDAVQTPHASLGVRHIYNQYVIRARDRDGLRAHLAAAGVGTEVYYPVPLRFERDPGRFERLSREHAGLLVDFSRQRLDEIALAKLFQLADVIGLRARIKGMWQGAHINTTEDRAVLHVALRQPRGAGVGGADIEQAVMAERARVLKFAQGVREGTIRGSAREPFKLVVNIGIGGSDLGPAMAVQALAAFTLGAPRCEFVSNVDGVRL